ncbi:hypothetical protein MAPG_02060 [Magnaporthiopsis poae ATCC 64411]|uniref:Thioredoxin domain-containing protein n=1 Tax=Magnaporthiopsis poae (strain ATCC 64411 / 73-15) TaxID=644358 RepID=A0A0C4DQC1_MAGP6|nr:hypothetical protein MAPG_02060 [Magnaporthiopsis poae ATCC 64411]
MTIHIESTAQWRQVLGSSSIVVTDFYADWCGPCKMIAPTFESLSTKFSKPNKIAFCKVDVDNQREIAQQYSVSAMPTFLILRNGTLQRPLKWDINSLVNSIIVFFGLYFVSLFSLDPYKSAEASKYNVRNPPAAARPAGGAGQRPGAPKPAFRTLADMGGD